jgi:hypothetical protein
VSGWSRSTEVQRRSEDTLGHHAGDVGPQRYALEVRRVSATEHDGSSWEEVLAVPEQELQRRPHDCDDEIQLLAPVLPLIVVAEQLIVVVVLELREVHRFRVEIDVLELRLEGRAEALMEDGEARELLVLVVEEQNALRGRSGNRRGGSEHQDHEGTSHSFDAHGRVRHSKPRTARG